MTAALPRTLIDIARAGMAPTPNEDKMAVKYSYDGEWAFVGPLAVYQRSEEGTWSIGRLAGARTYHDVEEGFASQMAAVEHAIWMVEESRS